MAVPAVDAEATTTRAPAAEEKRANPDLRWRFHDEYEAQPGRLRVTGEFP
jgi:hypothetical protein